MAEKSPFKALDPGTAMVAGSVISAGVSLIGGKKQRKSARRAESRARSDRAQQQALLEAQKDEYRALQFTNPYEDMENPFEDLRVATGAADFQAQQGAQQRANILGSLRGAAGSSGIAGLAQTLANQGALQAQKISVNLQQQEVRNELLRAKGASSVDMQERTGDAMVQQAESSRQATMLGMQFGQAAGANAAYQQAVKNTQMAQASANQMMAQSMSNLTSMYGTYLQTKE